MEMEISEKSDKAIKKSITYLTIGFWTLAVWGAFALIASLANFYTLGAGEMITIILVGVALGLLLKNMHSYIKVYKTFRETKTEQAFENLLEAQKRYYGFIYILPLIMIGLAIIASIIGDFQQAGGLHGSMEQIQTHVFEPKGVFSEIQIEKHNEAISILLTGSASQKKSAMESVQKQPNDYNPVVLYVYSGELLHEGNIDEAMFWYYVAQLQARYDANLCMDNSAASACSVLTEEFGDEINIYAFQDLDKLESIFNKVIEFVRTNTENYDHRWINLHGLWAFGGEEETRELSKPKDEWEAIKKKTIDDYYNGFIASINLIKKERK